MKRNNLPRRAIASTLASALLVAPLGAAIAAPAYAEDTPLTIADVQGASDATPYLGKSVTVRGVVTAVYATGGFNSYVIQTPGAPQASTTGKSDAITVYQKSVPTVKIGDYLEVTGTAGEFNGLTQISSPTHTVLTDTVEAPQPLSIDWPKTNAEREKYEGMLFAPTGTYTVSNTYSTSQYGDVGLAFGNSPLVQPTEVGTPGSDAAKAQADRNAEIGVILDDGSNTDFTKSKDEAPPFISLTNPVRVGAAVTFTEPMIIDYRNNKWKLNPTTPMLAGAETVSFKNTRTSKPDVANLAGSDIKVASFNVLNYFTTTGDTWPGCTAYTDRSGVGITVKSCPGNGPRGAWDAASLKRQQSKIVAAINATDADVIGLMEIENSAVLGEAADEAVSTLVKALNVAAGSSKWDYVRSSKDLPAVAEQDVITNAIIFQKAAVKPVGESHALGDQSGAGEPFINAREPLGQAFEPVAGGEPFFVVVNHLKSKGSAGPLPGDADSGDGQGASNASRVAQANALVTWIPQVLETVTTEAGKAVKDVALVGDFNSYSEEDPMHVLYKAGYTNANTAYAEGQYSYSYQGMSGSLDHVLFNESLGERTVGADIWEINGPESIALEYSRYNNFTQLYHASNAFRSSDHDPVILGFTAGTKAKTTTLNLLDINDFHGRIDANTVKFAGTIEKARAAAGEDKTLFISAGDNIGASLFASAVADDKPTLDVLNALDLATSAVGNHEFDKGWDDLSGRVNDQTNFNYLGANVYAKGTKTPVLKTHEIITVDGIKVGIIGAITQETPTLVSPGGISNLDFGDPVEAVNKVAAQLSDGKAKNGEADVLVALYHEGASAGTPDGSNLETEVDHGGIFADMVTKTDAEVDAIFTGHTHKQYAWLANNGSGALRPVIQTGSYGEYVGQALLTVDLATKDVVDAEANNLARLKDDDAALIAAYPRVAKVSTIVTEALKAADVVGKEVVGSVAADITSGYSGGSYVDGAYVGGKRDNRAEASPLGTLVADALRSTLSAPERGGAQIGVVNPGGLRADLDFDEIAKDGSITYAEANAVLPFVNNLWTTNLTGAQVKTMLEQQWQRDSKGNVPSRPYLQLGLSENVTYTFDETRAEGDRITSITVDGKPIDPAATYVIGTFSFLAQAGDNFWVFNESTGTKDSGLIDRDAWIAYLKANQNLKPNFARSGVEVIGLNNTAEVGETLTFTAQGMNIEALGAPENTELTAQFVGGELSAPVAAGTFPITADAASVSFAVPAGAAGATTLQLIAKESGTTANVPVAVGAGTVTPDPAVATTTVLKAGKSVSGKTTTLTATVTAKDTAASALAGKVTFYEGKKSLGSATVKSGKATLSVKVSAGKHSITAKFVPTDAAAFSGSTSKSLTVSTAKASSSVKAKLSTSSVTYPSTAKVAVTVTGSNIKPTGKVEIYNGSKKLASATLKAGKGYTASATVKLPKLKPGSYKLTAKYVGSSELASSTTKLSTLKVSKYSTKTSWSVTYTGKTVKVAVTGKGTPSGKVTLTVDGKKAGTATLKGGKATFSIKSPGKGLHTYKVSYSGSDYAKASSSTKRFLVR